MGALGGLEIAALMVQHTEATQRSRFGDWVVGLAEQGERALITVFGIAGFIAEMVHYADPDAEYPLAVPTRLRAHCSERSLKLEQRFIHHRGATHHAVERWRSRWGDLEPRRFASHG
jgi:hypothetical protein